MCPIIGRGGGPLISLDFQKEYFLLKYKKMLVSKIVRIVKQIVRLMILVG
jgi:hypothetical protein